MQLLAIHFVDMDGPNRSHSTLLSVVKRWIGLVYACSYDCADKDYHLLWSAYWILWIREQVMGISEPV